MTKEEMTNEISVEEAIEVFKFMKRDVLEESKEDKVIDMAIKALEQQPCEDCISRESVIKIIENKLNPCTDMFKCLEMSEIKEDVGHLPSVKPQQGWIPVSEKLPKENEYIGNVCKYYLIQDEYGDMHVAHLSNVGWIPMDSLKAIGDEIIAWQPLPQPYSESEE